MLGRRCIASGKVSLKETSLDGNCLGVSSLEGPLGSRSVNALV